MMSMRVLAIASALVAGATSASASVYDWSFTVDSDVVASGQLSTTGTANGVFGQDLTTFTGSVYGAPITGLVSNGSAPGMATSPDGLFFYDNDLDPGAAPYVDNNGLLFDVGPSEYNIYSVGNATYLSLAYGQGSAYNPGAVGVLALSAPEPAAWALMLLGFGGLGVALRSTRRRALAAV